MLKKTVLLALLLVVLGIGTAFAHTDQLGGLSSRNGAPGITDVYVNPGGLGDALLYGYYNVRGYETYFTVTNTDTNHGARVRLRFREAATIVAPNKCNGSYEVLDFDICLSKGDMWGGWIEGVGGNARLFSWDVDTYVVTEDGSRGVIFPDKYPTGVPFKTTLFSSLSNAADITREGYFEIIAEDQLSEECDPDASDCTCGDLYDTGVDVGNVLMGHAFILNVSNTATFAYDATALADFASGNLTSGIGTPHPNIDDGDGGAAAVEFVLTKKNLFSIYDLEPNFGKTAAIVTFPTKWVFHTSTYNTTTGKCDNGTDDLFDDERVLIVAYDDAEHSPQNVCEFSPCDPGTDFKLPHEVNVIDFNGGGIFTSDVRAGLSVPFEFGWFYIDLNGHVPTTSDIFPLHRSTWVGTSFSGTTYFEASRGLPAIGYLVTDFEGGKESAMLPLQFSEEIEWFVP